MSQKVLLTGAGGFIGKVVAARLKQAGYSVRAVSRDPGRLTLEADEIAALPLLAAGDTAWDGLVNGVDHVVHAAGIAHSSRHLSDADYFDANAELPAILARAARRLAPGHFVFISSIRAMCGGWSQAVLTEDAEPRPVDSYGRSKLEGERRVALAFHGEPRYTVLRPTLVYGPHPKGNLAVLQRLAALRLPLPIAGLDAPRSLLDVQSLADAVIHALLAPALAGKCFIVSDRHPVTVAQMIAAMRLGLDREPGLFRAPPALIRLALASIGRGKDWERMAFQLVANPARLEATGWQPVEDTSARLSAYVRSDAMARLSGAGRP